MQSYDQILALLADQLSEAQTRYDREAYGGITAREQLRKARERYEAFALHGMVPEELSEGRTSQSG